MVFKIKATIMLFAVFLLSIYAASASVDVQTVTVTPSDPATTDALDCSFIVTGNESSYSVEIAWDKDGSSHGSDTETLTAQNGSATSTSSQGDIEASDTSKGESWVCIVEATDSSNNTDSSSSAAVTIANSAPVITSSPGTSARTEEQYTYAVQAQDDDGDSLSYTLAVKPAGMSISGNDISWTPNASQSGSYNVRVEVSDGTDTVSQSFTIDVISNKLIISDIDASCDPSCEDDLDEGDANDGDAGSITEVRPGASLTLTFQVENIWDEDADDHDIEDIEIVCELLDIGEDDDDQEEDVDFDDLDPDEESDEQELEFSISREAEDGDDTTIECTLTGEDEDGTEYETEFSIDVEIEKEDHSVVFSSINLNPSTISCARSFNLDYEVKNLGAKDEDDVQITVRNSQLDIFRNEVVSEIEEGDYDDDDTEYSSRYSFTVGEDVSAGTYPIRLEVFFDDGDESEIETVDLTVQDCVTEQPDEEQEEEEEEEQQEEQEEEREDVEVIQQPTTPPTQQPGDVVAQPVTTVTDEEGFTDSVWFVVLLAAIALGLLGVAILLVAVLLKQ